MWALTNQTRFKAERTFARDAEGAEIWIVAVRGTFSIESDGELTIADEQQDICLVPKFFGDPGFSSLRYDSDLVRTKSGTDVVLHAKAHAPKGQPAQSVDVGFTVGPISKKLRIVGDRVWRDGWADLEPGEPKPFLTMPIVYERAWGGLLPDRDARDETNPAGVGLRASRGSPVPNVELIDNPIRSPRYSGPAAGFGPVASHWLPRRTLAGTYDDDWKNRRQPLVPADFKESFFRCAPADQQFPQFLRGGEEVNLHNLTPDGMMGFTLPTITLGFRSLIAGGVTYHRAQLHTVIVEPDERRVVLVWQTALPCHHAVYTLKQTHVFEKTRVSANKAA